MSAPEKCGSCGQDMTAYVTVAEKKIHAECFTCVECKDALAGKPFVNHEGSFYCEADYHKKFGKTCAHCEQGIKGQYVEALGKTWCPNHFVCSGCGSEFKNDQFRKHEERPWCEDCYIREVADTCGKCNTGVTGKCFEAMGKKFHEACFVCCNGDHKIGDGETFFESDNQLYCKDHFTQKMAIACSECGKAIEAEYLQLPSGNKIHKDCWSCCGCKTAMTQETVGSVSDGNYMCKTCTAAGKTIPAAAGAAAAAPAAAAPAAAAVAAAQSSELPAIEGKTDKPELGESRSSWIGTAVPLDQPKSVAIASLEAEKKIAIDKEDFMKANELKEKLEKLKLADDTGSSAPNPATTPKVPTVFYPLSYLQMPKTECPVAFDYSNREIYLADDDFFTLFACTKEAFTRLPAWRKKMKKQDAGLF